VLAAAVNSPLLFGHRLWQETRVALFQHSTDERSSSQLARSQPTRVSFGDAWLRNSVIDLFHDQICRFRPIMIAQADENPFAVLARLETPQLSALRLHNGTVWRWNRACYGVSNNVAHLRIENRALPSGPTVIDEIANAAFFAGLMLALPEEYGEIAARMSFDDAKSNFFRAARHGLDTQFHWLDGQTQSAVSLILDHLLPLARQGLSSAEITPTHIDKYLGVIEERVRERRTGARWILESLAAMPPTLSKDVRNRALTTAMLNSQKQDLPGHRWPITRIAEDEGWEHGYRTVGQFMSTDLFTVQPDDLIDLAASVMDWRHIRHVPVEDGEGRLIGLVSHRALLRVMSQGTDQAQRPITVSEIMIPNPLTVGPSTTSLEAIELMRTNRIGCLPVVEGEQLLGIVTSYDFLDAVASLFQQHLGGNGCGKYHTAESGSAQYHPKNQSSVDPTSHN
jgi:CBS domain-containing protein